eukprot:GILJ01003376.1.p1 GENE.GILJ01003376.1~~GILJ01003376.1.p1  ORF type:complete len:191 (-),score=38.52 GILJ01003376.1:93-665(-)
MEAPETINEQPTEIIHDSTSAHDAHKAESSMPVEPILESTSPAEATTAVAVDTTSELVPSDGSVAKDSGDDSHLILALTRSIRKLEHLRFELIHLRGKISREHLLYSAVKQDATVNQVELHVKQVYRELTHHLGPSCLRGSHMPIPVELIQSQAVFDALMTVLDTGVERLRITRDRLKRDQSQRLAVPIL